MAEFDPLDLSLQREMRSLRDLKRKRRRSTAATPRDADPLQARAVGSWDWWAALMGDAPAPNRNRLDRVRPRNVTRSAALAIVHVLGRHAARDGSRVFPSLKVIVDEAGVARQTAVDMRRELEATGWLTRLGARGRGVEYQLTVPGVTP